MRLIAIAITICFGLIWIIGSYRVRKAYLRRAGQPSLVFDLSFSWLSRLNAQEKHQLFWYSLASLPFGFLGSGILNGVFG
jgi:hypothetical protein